MARFNGGVFSKVKGKLAGIVFQQYEGMQVGKEYQPNVKNPSTSKQIAVRASFKLASQITAIYEFVMLAAAAKVSIYTRMVRGKVVATLRSAIGVSGGDNPIISLSEVATAINTIQATTPVDAPIIEGEDIGHATVRATQGDLVRYTVVAYDAEYNIIGTANHEFTESGAGQSIIAPITATTPTNYDIMAVAMRAMTTNGNAIYGNIDADYSLVANRLINSGDAAVSHVATATIPQE